jgi:predicted RNase H-like HicB family nuclease
MPNPQRMTAIIEREDDGFVALCPELDIASQGSTIEEARANLIEALTLFLGAASHQEVRQPLPSEVFVMQVEVPVGLFVVPRSLSLQQSPPQGRSNRTKIDE